LILKASRPAKDALCEVKKGSEVGLSDIVAFLRCYGATKQFFPFYIEDDFRVGSPTTLGFRAEDFIVARRGGEIIGVMGLWDQSEYKQTVVQAYNGSLRWMRSLYNLGAKVAGIKPLPAPGQHVRAAYASFVCIKGNDPRIFKILLRHLYNTAARRGYAYLITGLSTRDPLLPVARLYPHIAYHSRLYTVCWKEERSFHERLDKRIPYIEIATL
jgi:hypothetical protein